MIELTRLQAFRAVAEHQSYTKAAEALFLSQPRVHTLVRDLERALGVKLIEQVGKTSHLTEAGRALYDYGTGILRSVGDAEVALGEVKRQERGSLYVGLTESAPRSCIFTALGRLREQYPGIDLRVIAEPHALLEQALLNRDVDIAILAGGSEVPGLGCQGWHREPLAIVRPPGHAGVPLLTSRALARTPFVHYHEGCELRAVTSDWFATAHALEGTLQCASPSDAIAAAAADLGHALVPASLAEAAVAAGSVAFAPTDAPLPSVEYVVATLEERDLPPSALAFLAALATAGGTDTGHVRNER